MTAMTVPKCRCGLQMRIAADRDACECRCGLWIAGELLFSGQPIADAAFQQGEPWKEPTAGIRVSNDFADIGPLAWEYSLLDQSAIDTAALELACCDAFEGSGLRYVGRVTPCRVLNLDTSELLRRQCMYAITPLGQEPTAIRQVVQAIRGLHGPGRMWAHGDAPVAPMQHYESGKLRGAELGGVMHVVLACYYFHKPDGPR